MKLRSRITLALVIGAIGYLSGPELPTISRPLVPAAEARIGRPLTPMSYAGVARRTTRRAVAAGAAVGGAVYVAPTCTRVVNAYGQWVTVCR